MEYISSDTNVWFDFVIIDKIELPFMLPYKYIMNEDAIDDEMLSPKALKDNLISLGLQAVELSEEEFYLAEKYNAQYTKPSVYDCVALAIAKVRGITLMTGDGALRKAAKQENVPVIGTIGILDQLHNGNYIAKSEYLSCLEALLKENGKKVRLPKSALLERLDNE